MPFHKCPPDVGFPGFDFASTTEPYHGEVVNGDGLFIEVGRIDDAVLLLLLDVTSHGPKTAPTMATVSYSLADMRATRTASLRNSWGFCTV